MGTPPMSPRARRCVPRTSSRAVTTKRDTDGLELLAWGGFLATRHFIPRVYGSRRVAERRLRALLDLRLVRARVQAGALHKDTVFALTAAGVRLLEEERELEGVVAAAFPRTQKLDHSLAIRDVFVTFLIEAERAGVRVEDIVFESDDGVVGLRQVRLVPDLVVHLAEGILGGQQAGRRPPGARVDHRLGRDEDLGVDVAGPVARGGVEDPILVEVDLGHERRGVLEEKLARYERCLAAGPGRLLFVAKSARRAAAVIERLRALAPRVIVASLAELSRGVAECTFRPFVRTRRAVRTGQTGQLPVPAVVSEAPGSAFRVARRGVRGPDGR